MTSLYPEREPSEQKQIMDGNVPVCLSNKHATLYVLLQLYARYDSKIIRNIIVTLSGSTLGSISFYPDRLSLVAISPST